MKKIVKFPEKIFRWIRIMFEVPEKIDRLDRDIIMFEVPEKIDRLGRDIELLKRRSFELVNSNNIPLAGNIVSTKTRAGLRMFIDNRDAGSGFDILATGHIEPNNTRLFQKLIRPGSTFLDIGANFGYYTLLGASLVRANGHVFAFEANDNLIPLIDRSIFSNGFTNRVVLHHTAVSDRSGAAEFGFSFDGIGGGSLQAAAGTCPTARKIAVRLSRIDDLLPPETVVDCVKIDVEGHEIQALRGMEATLRRSPDVSIVFEYFTSMQEGGAGEMRLPNYLRGLGFNIWQINGDGFLAEISDAELARGGDLYLLASRKKPNDREIVLGPSSFQLPKHERACRGAVLMYGPYMALSAGRYKAIIEGEIIGQIRVAATHEVGLPLGYGVIAANGDSFEFDVPQDAQDFEVSAMAANDGASLRLDRVRLIDLHG